MRILKERIATFQPEEIHFIDSGNHHYMSKLWTDKITSPFSLVVFDHHPDMQPSFIMYTQFPAVAIFFSQQENQYLYFLEFYTVHCLLDPGAWRENNTCIFYGCRAYLFLRSFAL